MKQEDFLLMGIGLIAGYLIGDYLAYRCSVKHGYTKKCGVFKENWNEKI